MLLCASVLALTAAAAARADTTEVVVTGRKIQTEGEAATKLDTPLVETAQSISVIDRGELDLRGVVNLNDALRYTAGVGPETRGNTAGRYDLMTLRGFSPDQYLDGLRLVPSSNGYDIPQMNVAMLDKVEVVKGPASVLYGQASPGGLVALSSKLPTQDRFGEVSIAGGTFGSVQGAFDFGGPVASSDKLFFRLDGEADRSDTQILHTEAQRYAISPALTWRPDDKTSWTVLYNYQTEPKGGAYGADAPQGSVLPNPHGDIPRDFYDSEPAFDRFSREQQMVSSFFTRDLGDGWTFRQNTRFMHVTSSYRSVYSLFFEPDLRTLDRGTAAADESLDALTVDNQLTGKVHTGSVTHSLIAGLDYQHTGQSEVAGFGSAPSIDVFAPIYGAAVTEPATSFNVRLNLQQVGLYAQDQLAWGGWRLLLGGRYDWVDANQYDRLARVGSPLSEQKFTGRAGLLYLFDNGLAPYASYSTSFQPQTAVSVSGALLPPTQGKQAELGVKYQPKIWNALLTLSAYDLRQTNVATQDPNAAPGFSVAAGEVRSRGVELEGRATPRAGVELFGSYTYLDNQVTKDNSGLQGARPYGVPQQTANLYGVYTLQDGPAAGLGLGGGVRSLGRNFNGVVGAGAITIPGATLFDLVANYDLGRLSPNLKGATLSANIDNLFDTRYVTSCYSTLWCWYGSSRTAQATLRYRW